MYIGYNFMVSVQYIGGVWHQEYFIDEKSAKQYANNCCMAENTLFVEKLIRGKNGYSRQLAVKRHHEKARLWAGSDGKDYVI